MGPSGYILALDVGSSSVRCSLYDEAGNAVEDTSSRLRYGFSATREGAVTMDADELLGLVSEAVDGTLARAKERSGSIVGVATSAFWHGVLGVDRQEHPTTPVLTWADRRAASAADELRERLDEPAIHKRTGCLLHPSYLPAKLLWLARSSPETFVETERFLSPGEYIYLKLFGEARISTSMASGTGLLDLDLKTWDTKLLGELPFDKDQLSPISDEPSSGLREEWARRWPALRDVPWFPAAGDGACSNAGSGCVGAERVAVMVGTSGAVRVLWRGDRARVAEGLWCYRADAERFVAGGALSDGGNLVSWLRQTLRLPEPEETERLLARMEPGSHGLTFLPLLAGERAIGWAKGGNGTVVGLSMATRPVEILRAAMEAVALRLTLIVERLDEVFPEGADEREVVATGGALLSSPAWVQMLADALGKSVTVSGIREASARGAALLALERLGGPDIGEFGAFPGGTYRPDPSSHAVYREELGRQRRLYDAVVQEKD